MLEAVARDRQGQRLAFANATVTPEEETAALCVDGLLDTQCSSASTSGEPELLLELPGVESLETLVLSFNASHPIANASISLLSDVGGVVEHWTDLVGDGTPANRSFTPRFHVAEVAAAAAAAAAPRVEASALAAPLVTVRLRDASVRVDVDRRADGATYL